MMLRDRIQGAGGSHLLRRNYRWMLSGNAYYALCQWAMLIALAKFGRPELVGEFALALAITAPVYTFACLNLRSVQATDARREHRFAEYLGLRLVAVALAQSVVSGIIVICGYSGRRGLVIAVVGAAKAFEAISDICYGLAQQNERMERIGRSLMLKGTLQVSIFTVAARVTGDLLFCVAGQALANALVLVVYDRRSARFILAAAPGRITWARLAALIRPRAPLMTLARLALPLGAVATLDSLNLNVPRYFLEHSWGAHRLGVYSAMAYLMFPGGMIAGSFYQAASARLAQAWTRDIGQFRALLLGLVRVGAANGLAGVVGALLFGGPFLSFLYRPEYAREPLVLAYLMTAAGVGYVASGLAVGLYAARRFSIQLPIEVAGAGVTLAACFLLVPRFGLAGAAWALILGMSTWCLGCAAALAVALRSARAASSAEAVPETAAAVR